MSPQRPSGRRFAAFLAALAVAASAFGALVLPRFADADLPASMKAPTPSRLSSSRSSTTDSVRTGSTSAARTPRTPPQSALRCLSVTRRLLLLLGLAIAEPACRRGPAWRAGVDGCAGGRDIQDHLPDGHRDLRPCRPGARLLARELGAPGHRLRAADALSRQAAAAGLPDRPGGRGLASDRLDRRQNLDVQAPHRLPLQRRQPGPRGRVRAGDPPHDGTRGRLARL